MPVIATEIEPHGVTRIFLDCRPAAPDPHDEARIARAIARAQAAATADPERLPRAA
jgi:hypothetical protein